MFIYFISKYYFYFNHFEWTILFELLLQVSKLSGSNFLLKLLFSWIISEKILRNSRYVQQFLWFHFYGKFFWPYLEVPLWFINLLEKRVLKSLIRTEMERNLGKFSKNFNRRADFETFVRAIPQEGHSVHYLNTHRQKLVLLWEVFRDSYEDLLEDAENTKM